MVADSGRNMLAGAIALSAMLMGGALLCISGGAVAQQMEVGRQYDIAEQSLIGALNQLAIQSGVEIMVSPDLARDLRAQALKGRYRFEHAIEKLLKGSGLAWKRNERGLVTVGTAIGTTKSNKPGPETKVVRDGAAVTDMPELLVKGSRSLNADIRRSIDDPQPYVVFEREEIERSGAVNINDFMLRRVSANTAAAGPAATGQLFGNRSSVNLRGLGEAQTLVLIDGRRVASSYTGFTPGQPDLNGIPLAAVERIEILPSTASAIHGGAATGGVVNVILRRDYRGGELALSHDDSFDTDSSIHRIDLSYGREIGRRTTIMVSASHSETNLMLKRDRDFRERGLEHAYRNDLRFLSASLFTSTSANVLSQTGVDLSLRGGTPLNAPITHVPKGYLGPASDGGAALVVNAGRINGERDFNGASANGGSSFGTGGRDNRASLSLRHGFSDRIDAFLDISYSESRSKMPSGSNSRFSLPVGHVYNPFDQAIFVLVPSVDGNAINRQRNDANRVSGGLIGRLGESWAASLDFTWSKSTNFYSRGTGSVNFAAAMAAGFNPLVDYYNLGGLSLAPYLTNVGSLDGPSSVYTSNPTLRFSGPLWQLPAGPVSASLLLEQQDVRFSARVSRNFPGAANETHILFPARSQEVRSSYAELSIPLVGPANASAAVRLLDIQLAMRHDRHDILAGNSITWLPAQGAAPDPVITRNSDKRSTGLVGLRYAPLSGLMLRASHGTGFVPPDIVQLGASTVNSAGFLSVPDPRRGNTANPTTVMMVSGGNPDLSPETSKTTTLGVVVQPDSLPGFRFSLDYTRLEKRDNIAVISPALMLQYEDLFPGRVGRGPNLADDPPDWAGPVTFLDTSRINAASARYEMLDAHFKHGFETDGGTYLELWGAGTWTLRAEQRSVAGGPLSDLRGVSTVYTGGAAIPLRFRGVYGLNLERAGWGGGWSVSHYSQYRVADPGLISSTVLVAAQGGGGRVPRQMLHDIWAVWKPGVSSSRKEGMREFLAGAEFSGGIRNVFNTKPEVDMSNVSYIHSYLVDPRLRTYYLQIKYVF